MSNGYNDQFDLDEWVESSDIQTVPQVADSTSPLLDFFGNLSWGTSSGASWGALDVAALTEPGKKARSGLSLGTYRPWEEQTPSGKAGYIIGQGLGMVKTFGWVGKGLGLLSKTFTPATGKISTYLTAKAGKDALSKFGEAKGREAITKFGRDFLSGNTDELAAEALERGTIEAMKKTTKMINTPAYKKLWKFNQTAYNTAKEELSTNLLKSMPTLGVEGSAQFADNLISSAMKYSTHNFHNWMDGVVMGKVLKGMAGTRTGQALSAMASDAVLGFTHHGAQAAIENFTYGSANILGADIDKNELRQFDNINSGFGDIVKHSVQSGLWMSLIGPTRFIGGGRPAAKLNKEISAGLNTLRKAWKPASRMSEVQAKATLELINHASADNLKKVVPELVGKEISKLTKKEAIDMVKIVRKRFSGEWLRYIKTEARKDIWGSAPRMIAGAVAMNLPGMKEYYKQTGKLDAGFLGSDPTEIVSNIMVGMVMAKGGRTFGDGKGSTSKYRLWEGGELRQYYTNNIKKIKALRVGLETIGIKDTGTGLNFNNVPVELRARYLINSGEYKEVHDILGEYYVTSEDSPIVEGRFSLDQAYKKEVGELNELTSTKLRIASEVLGHYDEQSTDIGTVMRHVTPGEAKNIVDNINNIKGIIEHKSNPTVWLNKVTLKAADQANERFKQIQDNFIFNMYESLGIDMTGRWDRDAGIMRLPEINLKKILDGNPADESGNTIRAMIEAHHNYVENGKSKGYVEIEGSRLDMETIKQPQRDQLIKNFVDHYTIMNESTYGNANNTMIMDTDILSDKNMWTAYNTVRTDIDIQNALYTFTDSGREYLFTNLNKVDIDRLDRAVSNLQLNRSTIPVVGDKISEEGQIKNLSSYYTRIKTIHNLLIGNKDSNVKSDKPVTMDTISESKKVIDSILGDVFDISNPASEAVYERLVHSSLDHMINTLDIQSLNRNHQLKHSLVVLMNGGVGKSGQTVGDLNKYGGMVRRKPGGNIEIPTTKELFDILEQSNEFQKGELDNLKSYYGDFELGMKGATGPIAFTPNTDVITNLIKQNGGATNVRNLLNMARIFSQVGHIKDLNHGYIKLSEFIEKMNSDKELYIEDYEQTDNYDNVTSESLKSLVKDLGTLRANIQHLIGIGDYSALIDMNITEMSNFTESLDRFQKMDLSKMTSSDGAVDKKYQDALAGIIIETNNKLSQPVLSMDNINAYVDEQIANNTRDVRTKEHALRINTSPTEFEGNYGVSVSDQNTIIETSIGKKTARNLNDTQILGAVEKLVNATRFAPTGSSVDQLYNDAWQVISSRVFSKEVKRVRYEGGDGGGILIETKVGYPYQESNDPRGMMGMRNFLFGKKEGWYILQKDMKWKNEGEDVARDVVVMDKDVIAMIDGEIEGGIFVESGTSRNEYLKQVIEGPLQESVSPVSKELVRVVLTEGTNLLVEKQIAREVILDAYGEGGELSRLVKLIFDSKGANEFLTKYRNPNMTIQDLKNGINDAWNILNNPAELVQRVGGDLDRSIELDYMKRRKLADFTKGHMLNDRFHSFMTNFYKHVSDKTGSDLSRILYDSYRQMRDDKGNLIPQKGITINDSEGKFQVSSRLNRKLDQYDEFIMQGIPREDVEQLMSSQDKEMTDSPVYLSKDAFMRYLGTLAPKQEFFQIENGEVVGFNIGAMKPKGVHVKIKDDGSMSVYYEKSAFFYNPAIAKALSSAGLDRVSFKSGNKINVGREGRGELSQRYTDAITEKAGIGAESIEDMIIWTIDGARERGALAGEVLELPWDTYMITQASVHHPGTVGANTGNHFSDRSGLNHWTQISAHIDDFRMLVQTAKHSPEAMTALGRTLSDMERREGNLNPVRTSLDSFLDDHGIVINDWMGDMIVDNLFSRYFQGSKIATREVKGSVYSPMEPFIADANVDLPVRYNDSSGMGRQRIFGGFQVDKNLANMPFKEFNKTTYGEWGDKNQLSTGFFIGRYKFLNPLVSNRESSSEFMIVPGKGKEFDIFVEGMELSKDGILIDMTSGTKVGLKNKESYKKLYSDIKSQFDDVREYYNEDQRTNEQVLDYLAGRGITETIQPGFRTAKGSVYTVEGNVTTRTKAPRPEHPGDYGLKEKSSRTVYMSDLTIQEIFGPLGELKTTRFDASGKEIPASMKMGKLGINIRGKFFNYASSKPKKGLSPFEVWVDKSGKIIRYHVGNKITEIIKKGKKTIPADNMWMGVMNVRQPRNGFDVIVNKIHREKKKEGDPGPEWKHYEEKSGNATRQNSVDVIKQDADHDFDKSNVYLTAPPDFIKEVAKWTGTEFTTDPSHFADLIFSEMNFQTNNEVNVKEWFQNVNNTSALRGRFVKLHQILTYLSNGIGEGNSLGKYKMNGKDVNIILKGPREYIRVVDEVGKMVKFFLDNYKDVVDIEVKGGFAPAVDNFIKDIIFGKEVIKDGHVIPDSGFEGLVRLKGELDASIIRDEGLKSLLYDNLIRPLNKYLTYNRGEISQGDIKSKMRLKDVHTGYRDVINAYSVDLKDKRRIIDSEKNGLFLNLDNGRTLMHDFLGHKSRNPFDVAMMSLSGAYDSALRTERTEGYKQTDIESMIFKAERGILLEGLSPVDGARSISRELMDMVKDEGDMAKLVIISDKLASASGDLDQLNANQYANSYDIKQAERRVEYFTNLKSELELGLGSKQNYLNKENVFQYKNNRKVGTVTAAGADWVVWRGNKISEVIRVGNQNENIILSNDTIVVGGRKFELTPLDKQDKLRTKWIAFGNPVLESVGLNSGRISTMSAFEYNGIIPEAYGRFTRSYGEVGSDFKRHRNGERLAIDRKVLLHNFLNDLSAKYGLTDALRRKAFIYKLMTPELDQNTNVLNSIDGKVVSDFRFTENQKISKTVYDYLTDVKNRELFSRDNNVSAIEADGLLKEMIRAQTLAHYGVTNPYSNVNMAFTRTERYLTNFNKRLIDIDKGVISAMNQINVDKVKNNDALKMINQFINGERLITPFDMARIAKNIGLGGERGSVNMFKSGESGFSDPIYTKRRFGKKGNTPVITIEEGLRLREKHRKEC